jgi:Uma2 family endonuclease
MNAPHLAETSPHSARFTVEEFLRLQDTGVFDRYAKTELIEGEIVCMNAQYSRHARVKSKLAVLLALKLAELRSAVSAIVEVAVQLTDESLPEPDIVLTDYVGDGAVPIATVSLIVEVADTTLANDLGRKAMLYAREAVAEYWVVDIEGQQIHRHSAPDVGGYGRIDVLAFGEAVMPITVAGLVVETASLLD